jgi:hypothetical protein
MTALPSSASSAGLSAKPPTCSRCTAGRLPVDGALSRSDTRLGVRAAHTMGMSASQAGHAQDMLTGWNKGK